MDPVKKKKPLINSEKYDKAIEELKAMINNLSSSTKQRIDSVNVVAQDNKESIDKMSRSLEKKANNSTVLDGQEKFFNNLSAHENEVDLL